MCGSPDGIIAVNGHKLLLADGRQRAEEHHHRVATEALRARPHAVHRGPPCLARRPPHVRGARHRRKGRCLRVHSVGLST